MPQTPKQPREREVSLAVTAERVIGTVKLSMNEHGTSALQMAMYIIAEDVQKEPAQHYEPTTYHFPAEDGGQFTFAISHTDPMENMGHLVSVH